MERIFRRAFCFSVLTIFCVSLTSCETKCAAPKTVSGATPIEWSERLANSEMPRLTNALKWDYTMGLFTLSLLKLNEQVPDARFVKFSEDKIGGLISPDGNITGYKPQEYQLDAINPGKTALALWQITGNDKYKKAAEILRRQLDTQPRTFDGGFWHKERYTNQMWLDGIYMAEPFYAEYGKLFGEPKDFDDGAKQIRLMGEHTYDSKTGLYFHGWDAVKVQSWANPQTGCSSNFWGRAVGWYAMAMVDTLDFFPTNHPARKEILSRFQDLCASVVKFQDKKTGLWWQVLDEVGRDGNYQEATASAMFTYAIAKGVNKNYLPENYARFARKGFDGIVNKLIVKDGGDSWSLTQCCSVAGLGFTNSKGHPRDGSFAYYVSEPITKDDLKGVGSFILAGIEVQYLPK
ncbi:MAG TPA: glycoside hydrolase family 88 protein [Verrucomicrobiae bacterium]|nr:glycoside hydrolase family 88 protein [Verrucomicrobiae bacterium]